MLSYVKRKLIVGWNEWCTLPDLNIPQIKAKIDTGTKTSALHAFDIHEDHTGNNVIFSIHPLQGDRKITIECHAPIVDVRHIMSSNGHNELRYVIMTTLSIGSASWEIEMTLSNRDPLKYRMLLGRSFMLHLLSGVTGRSYVLANGHMLAYGQWEQWLLAGGAVGRLLLAAALGCAIGIDREYRQQ